MTGIITNVSFAAAVVAGVSYQAQIVRAEIDTLCFVAVEHDDWAVTIPVTDDPVAQEQPAFEPKTKLGKRLWAQRQKIEASGEPLLPVADLMRELAEARGYSV